MNKKRGLIPIAVLILTVVMILFSSEASDTALESMKKTVTSIVPSLFPYMVLSSLIISSGAAQILGRLMPISKLFGLPSYASASLFIGAVCGFPLGAKSASELYQKGYLSKTEAEVLISITNLTGPTFLIFVIGSDFFKDTAFGIFLYLMQFISVIIASAIINKLIFPYTSKKHYADPVIEISSFLTGFPDAIRTSTITCLYICGFITFFSIIGKIINNIMFFAPAGMTLFIEGILEFSKACFDASLNGDFLSYFVCGFAVGWSGISVLCQTATFTSGSGLSLKRYTLVKAIEGLILGVLSLLYKLIIIKQDIAVHCISKTENIYYFHLLLVLLLTTILMCKHRKKNK